jgi:hypothetical protein
MSILKDLKSIRSGKAKAKRDTALALKFLADPSRWACEAMNPFCSDDPFWNTLSGDIDQITRPIEAASYGKTVGSAQFALRVAAVKTLSTLPMPNPQDERTPPVPVMKLTDGRRVLNVEITGSETPEELFDKATRAITENSEFEQIISSNKEK